MPFNVHCVNFAVPKEETFTENSTSEEEVGNKIKVLKERRQNNITRHMRVFRVFLPSTLIANSTRAVRSRSTWGENCQRFAIIINGVVTRTTQMPEKACLAPSNNIQASKDALANQKAFKISKFQLAGF